MTEPCDVSLASDPPVLQRNRIWVQNLAAILADVVTDQLVVTVVGKAHLYGEGSFIQHLQEASYRVITKG